MKHRNHQLTLKFGHRPDDPLKRLPAEAFAPVTGADPWCVPHALSALLGLDKDLIRVLLVAWFDEGWEGVRNINTGALLERLGVNAKHMAYVVGPPAVKTFWQWCGAGSTVRKGRYLVAAGGHMMAYVDGWCLDNGVRFPGGPMPYTYVKIGKKSRVTHRYRMPDTPPLQLRASFRLPAWAEELAEAARTNRTILGPGAPHVISKQDIEAVRRAT